MASTITPSERLSNLEGAARMQGDMGEEWVMLPDLSKLYVGYQCGHEISEAYVYKLVADGKSRYVSRETASGLMAWKWTTPSEI